jgi:hypothetical protein
MNAALYRYNAMPAGASNVIVRGDVLKRVGGFDTHATHLPDWDVARRRDPHAAWTAQGQAWLDDLPR